MMTTSNLPPKHKLSVETCVKHLNQSFILGQRALVQELSVCVAIYAGAGNISPQTKQLVKDVYKAAGYDVENRQSRHYKTVNRRLNASAALYSKLGQDKVQEWMGNAQEDSLLMGIAKGLETHRFESMDDVLDFTGRWSNRTRKVGVGRPRSIKPVEPMQKFVVAGVRVELPEAMNSENMMKMAAKIIKCARDKEQEELRNSKGHIRDIKAPMVISTMH